MALEPGLYVGNHEIRGLLGVGGMGEVYRARDSRLHRDVALKVLPDAVSLQPDRLARFAREAQVLASLNHPNIAAIYGLEEANGQTALVLELVDGPTLAERIAQGPIPSDEALPIAKQISEALEAAHEQGIVHRDLKPANIKVRADGTVKVLDFGLAKAMELAAVTPQGSWADSPTMSPAMMTGIGVVLGTAAYMSPEQARGKAIDRRADIWSFGCVLYEMLTGRRAFGGDTASDAIASILTQDADWSALPADTPPQVMRLLKRCLQKDLKRRLPHIGVARLEFEEGASAPNGDVAAAVVAPPRYRNLAPWIIAAALALAGVLAFAMLARDQTAAGAEIVRFSLNVPGGLRLGNNEMQRGRSGPAPHYAVSPDSSRIAYVMYRAGEVPRLWIRRLDGFDAQPLAGTENASFPFWSPDGQSIAFFANAQLKRIEVSGGPPHTVCDAATGEGGTWNTNGEIVFAPTESGGLFKVPAAGGVPAPLTQLDRTRAEIGHSWPQFLPDGRHYLYLARSVARESAQRTGPAVSRFAIYVGSLDPGDHTLLVEGAPRAQYAFGHLIFVRDTTLVAQAFDIASLRLHGEPEVLGANIAVNTVNGRTGFTASDGVLLYRPADPSLADSILSWFGRDGRQLGSIGSRAAYRAIRLSPDGQKVAAQVSTRNFTDPFPPGDLWMLDLSRGGISSRVTFTPDEPKDGVVWSHDGRRIAFAAGRAGATPTDLMQVTLGGAASPELLLQSPETKRPWSISPESSYMAYYQIDATTGGDVWVLSLLGDRKPRPFIQTPFGEGAGTFSPDGRWVAYQSTKANQVLGTNAPALGVSDIYVRSFPSGDQEVRISHEGGQYPQWRGDGSELFYLGADSRAVMAVTVQFHPTFKAGLPRKLFDAPTRGGIGVGQYSVASDGSRFLFIEPFRAEFAEQEPPLSVVLNWTSGLKAR
jgi:Tol biopolymer transport system component